MPFAMKKAASLLGRVKYGFFVSNKSGVFSLTEVDKYLYHGDATATQYQSGVFRFAVVAPGSDFIPFLCGICEWRGQACSSHSKLLAEPQN